VQRVHAFWRNARSSEIHFDLELFEIDK